MSNISRSQVSELQPKLQVTILRAHNLPRLKTIFGKKRRFYATFTDGERTWQTRSVRSVAQCVEWNETVNTFTVQPQSRVTICLYAKRTTRKDILVGSQEIACESQRELDVIFDNPDGRPTELVTPSLRITISAIGSSSMTAAVNSPILISTPVDPENPIPEGGAAHPTVKKDNEPMQRAADPALLSQTSNLPIEGGPSVGAVPDSQTEMSNTLDGAEKAFETMKTWSSAVEKVKCVIDVVGPIAELSPYAKTAWALLSFIPQTLLQQVARDDNVRTLLGAIRDGFEFAKEAAILRNIQPGSMQVKILDEMLQCVAKSAEFVESYAKDVQIGKRALKNIVGQVDGKVEEYRATLVRLRETFLAYAVVNTQATVLQMRDDKLNQALEAELDGKIRELPYRGGWRYGDEKRCLPGTREDFLHFIVKWVENPKSQRALVLLGQAGTGKSSIAHEVARRFEGKCLGSYSAFLRKEQSKDEAYMLFTTISRDLSDLIPAYKHTLGEVIKNKSSLRGTRDYRTLFENLLVEPLKDLPLPCPILIVIDALDESGDAIGKNGLHSFLAEHLVDLPSEFRILVTSRPEDGIEPAFLKAPSINTLYMDDAELALKTEQDIGLYLEKELPPDVFKSDGVKLAEAAEGLFQWAAVACGFINSPPASFGFSKKKCVHRLLGHSRDRSGQDPLDKLYEEVLEAYFKPDEAQILFRSVMGQIFAAIEPLSIDSLIALRRHASIDEPEDPDPAVQMLSHLGSLLSNVTSSDHTRPIVPLHTSFRDFLTSKKGGVFYVYLQDSHRQLAHSCLASMVDKLEFNICKLESSYVANSDIPDLESRIMRYISPALSYSCRFWGDHLDHLTFDDDLFMKLRSLLETKFLFWLEVLSLKSCIGLSLRTLSFLSMWLQPEDSQMEVKNLLGLVNDASRFVRYFGMTMARSTPHIYVSALPFTPSSSHIFNRYIRKFPCTLTLERGQLSHWPALEMAIQAHHGMVNSVAFSPDGQRVASASDDKTIRVWDATTGQMVAGPFTGHTNCVNSVAFSPDGLRIASASDDKTIWVWDATTGQMVAGPFTGHTNSVYSVAFSPDGLRIASASGDKTIRVWDAITGQMVAGPFTGHTSWIGSVAFSPDGLRIASASDDKTIQVWDATTGQMVAGPVTGHTSHVNSVAFSPDGLRIASASGDKTIRVWDATTGKMVAGPFTGHTHWVRSVAFSPDGLRIASASDDETIRVWDATTGQIVAGPFTGHTDWLCSVAFSPDGLRIASASRDKTIRVWDATMGQMVADPFTGHTNSVYSVAFSPDGLRIASASDDKTIRVWDATTGKMVAGPSTGHTDRVRSVAFSPDGLCIASASDDKTIRVWDATTGQMVAGPFTGHTNPVYSVAFSPDGLCIASSSHDKTIRVWDATTEQMVAGPFTGHADLVYSVAFSPDGLRIASASDDKTIRVWDATTGQMVAGLLTGHTNHVNSVAFSPDGLRIASASSDKTIRVWDATTGQMVAGPFTGHTNPVYSVAFSPDGLRIASASHDKTIRVWDATTGQMVAGPFTGHIGSVYSVAFSPDGLRIASGSSDCTIRMWDATTGQIAMGPFTDLIRSVREQHTASGSGDCTIHVESIVTEDIEKLLFTDQSLVGGDGWICGEPKQLLLWIPALHRPCLHGPRTVWIAAEHQTRLDFSKFMHGSNWGKIYDRNI